MCTNRCVGCEGMELIILQLLFTANHLQLPGRAAQRLQEVVDQPGLEAMTVHRLLGYKGMGGKEDKQSRIEGEEDSAKGRGQASAVADSSSWGDAASYDELSQV